MRFKLPPALLTLCALAALAAPAAAWQDGQGDQSVVEDFVTTRGVTFESPGKKAAPPQQSSRPAGKGGATAKQGAAPKGGGGKAAASKKTGPSSSSASAKKAGAGGPAAPKGGDGQGGAGQGAAGEGAQAAVLNASAAGAAKKPIGLGFTLFMKQGTDLVAADPAREFRQGDRLRIALETNTDGYLYIFHTENGRNPQMIFPNPAVDAGQNFVGAHARDFYPTDLSAWFEFDEVPATERLYFVVSRQPLAGVPAGRDLITACGGADADCLWKPTPGQWERIKSAAPGGRVIEGRNPQLAKLQAPPPSAMTRGLKVKKDEPAPALVRINESAAADLFVTTIDLIHK